MNECNPLTRMDRILTNYVLKFLSLSNILRGKLTNGILHDQMSWGKQCS